MDRDGVLRLLDERQAACRAQADRLRGEAERIAGLLAACQLELERVVTAREAVDGGRSRPALGGGKRCR